MFITVLAFKLNFYFSWVCQSNWRLFPNRKSTWRLISNWRCTWRFITNWKGAWRFISIRRICKWCWCSSLLKHSRIWTMSRRIYSYWLIPFSILPSYQKTLFLQSKKLESITKCFWRRLSFSNRKSARRLFSIRRICKRYWDSRLLEHSRIWTLPQRLHTTWFIQFSILPSY